MHVIIHIGMPKTGSTALQLALAKNRSRLKGHGILYPQLAHLGHAHHSLMPLFLPPDTVWGRVKEALGADLAEAALAQWQTIHAQVQRDRPATLVLSTEALFAPLDAQRLGKFAELIRGVADRITLVAYVREPASFYRSVLMERAKRSLLPRPPGPVSYRQPIEQLRDALDATVIVRPFDRASLHNADIGSDFLVHALKTDMPGMAVVESNVSLAPETAAVFQRFMAAKTSARRWLVRETEMQVIRDLFKIERELSLSKAVLWPAVAEQVTYTSKDIIWLRDAFGIIFTGVNYNRFGGNMTGQMIEVKSLRDAFEFNEEFYCQLLETARSRHAEFRHHLPAVAA